MINNDHFRVTQRWLDDHLRPGTLPVVPAPDPGWQELHQREDVRGLTQHPEGGWPHAPASLWLRTIRDGDRVAYEDVVFRRQSLLTRAVIRAAVNPGDDALDQVVDAVLGLCEQSSWSWPAHDDARARGRHLPDADEPYLDLGAGEVAAQLAWTDHLLGPLLEERAPGVRRRVRIEVDTRVLRPFMERHDWQWLGHESQINNWLPWIAGNVVTAALVLEEGERRSAVLVRAVAELGRFVDSLPEDGAIDEGFSYWWNGAGRLLEACEVLWHATGGAFDAWLTIPKLVETMRFPARMHLGRGWFVNVADGSARPVNDLAWPTLSRLARLFRLDDVVAFAETQRGTQLLSSTAHLGRTVMEIFQGPAEAPATLPHSDTDVWLPSVQLGVARQHQDGSGLTLVAKGGHNDESHNHNDIGSFIVALHGVPVVVDAGRPTYTLQTFSDRRYDIWTMQSAWHNVPAPGGAEQAPGRQYAARDVNWDVGEVATRFEAELADAYPDALLESWRRTVSLDRSDGVVELLDTWRFTQAADQSSHLVLMLAGTPHPRSGIEIEVEPVEGAGRLLINTGGPYRIQTRELDDPMLTSVWGTRLYRVEIDLGDHADGAARVLFAAVEPEAR